MNQKTNLNKPATKNDLKKFATKVDLKKTEKTLRGDTLRLEERVERIEDKLDGVEEKVNRIDVVEEKLDKIQNTLDSFLGRVDNLEKDNVVGAHQVRELRVAVDEHDKRIVALESPTQ